MLIVQRREDCQLRDAVILPCLFKLCLFLLSVLTQCLLCTFHLLSIFFTLPTVCVKTDHFESINFSLKLEGQIGSGSNISPLVLAFF